jgi:hypothetical protein
MLERVTRDLERERNATRTLRRDLEAAMLELAELRRARAVTPGATQTAEHLPAGLPRRGNAAHRVDVARAAGAHLVPDHRPSVLALWGTRVAAALLVGLLLVALALIVVPLL